LLKEIRCDKFLENGKVRKPIKLHSGLNSVIGASDGANSIGKSTFLMIIDFIFAGNDYVTEANDVIDNVGNHTIEYQFEFDNIPHYFSRSTCNNATFNICDENYNVIKELNKDDYCSFLAHHYGLDLPFLSLRQAISPFIRVWGRDTLDQDKPLKAAKNSPDKQGMETLLQIFNKYSEVEEQKVALKEAESHKTTFVNGTKYQYIAAVKNNTAFKTNEKRITELENDLLQLSEESNKGLSDLDSMQAQQLADLRRQLSNARRQRTKLIAQKKNFEAERNPSKPQIQKDFESLQNFFPEINIKKLSEIEQFHKQLASILKIEFTESSKNIQSMIDLASTHINDLEDKISKISDIPNVSQAILDKYADIQKEITLLGDSNNNYTTKVQLQNAWSDLKQSYDALIKEIFSSIQQEIDVEIRSINDEIYNGTKTAPVLSINSAKSYDFFTPQDRGTGSEYKGLIVFDLAMINQTPLPILVHDSVLLKQIQDNALEKILSIYTNQQKQIFIALDKESSYTPRSQELLSSSAVLRLYPDGGELFGQAWNEEKQEEN
jgi:Uncharacterized protein conserved in bacteria (DUF2326).